MSGREPTFSHLTQFVEEKALLANTMYGELVGSSPDKDQRNSRLKPKARTYNMSHERAVTMATQSELAIGASSQLTSSPNVPNCPLCSGCHKLSKCEQMKAKSPEERKAFVRQIRLCDNCFGRGYVANDCRSNMKCPVSGCGWKHHSMLHQMRRNGRFYTRGRIIRLDKLGQTFVVGRIMRL